VWGDLTSVSEVIYAAKPTLTGDFLRPNAHFQNSFNPDQELRGAQTAPFSEAEHLP
jgi:hypothetical protein